MESSYSIIVCLNFSFYNVAHRRTEMKSGNAKRLTLYLDLDVAIKKAISGSHSNIEDHVKHYVPPL